MKTLSKMNAKHDSIEVKHDSIDLRRSKAGGSFYLNRFQDFE